LKLGQQGSVPYLTTITRSTNCTQAQNPHIDHNTIADFQVKKQSYDLDAAHSLDFQNACITNDVGRNEHGMSDTSLKQLYREIDLYALSNNKRSRFANNLYVSESGTFPSMSARLPGISASRENNQVFDPVAAAVSKFWFSP
jgi:hypothetical protein